MIKLIKDWLRASFRRRKVKTVPLLSLLVIGVSVPVCHAEEFENLDYDYNYTEQDAHDASAKLYKADLGIHSGYDFKLSDSVILRPYSGLGLGLAMVESSSTGETKQRLRDITSGSTLNPNEGIQRNNDGTSGIYGYTKLGAMAYLNNVGFYVEYRQEIYESKLDLDNSVFQLGGSYNF